MTRSPKKVFIIRPATSPDQSEPKISTDGACADFVLFRSSPIRSFRCLFSGSKLASSELRLVHSGKLSVDWNGQENVSLSCELWVGTNDFNTKKNVLVRSNPRIILIS